MTKLGEKIGELIRKAILDYNQDPNPECAFGYYVPDVANQILNIPIERQCERCYGVTTTWVNKLQRISDCPACNGSGVKTTTLGKIYEEWKEGK